MEEEESSWQNHSVLIQGFLVQDFFSINTIPTYICTVSAFTIRGSVFQNGFLGGVLFILRLQFDQFLPIFDLNLDF